MDEAGNHHSQQTDTRTENQIPHVLTHKWMSKNENTWTQGGEHHTPGPIEGWGARMDSRVWRNREGIVLGEIPNVDDGVMEAANPWHVYTYVTNLHVVHMYPKT